MTDGSPRHGSKPSYAYEWYVVVICMLAYIFSFVDRQILALMIEPIKHDLQLSDTQFSLLHGLAFSLFYAFMGIPIALLADRYSRPRIIAIGVAFWSLATAACGLSRNFAQMFLARIGVGVGEAALSPATYSMLSDMFPREKLGRAVGIYSIGSFIGGGMAFLIGGYVINLLKSVDTVALPWIGAMRPWQVTFFIVGLPGLLIALLILLTVRDPQRLGLRRNASGQVQKPAMEDTFRFLGRHRSTFFCHYLGFSFYAMVLFALLGWTPAFYMRKFGMSPSEAGYMLGVVVLVANTAGVFCGGWLMDWLAKRGYSDAPLRAGVIGAAGMALPAVVFTQVDSLWWSVGLLLPAMFFASFPMPTSTAAMQILPPNQLRAQVSALFLLISNLIGLGLGTTAVAMLTDRLFKNPAAVGQSMSVLVGVATVLCIGLLAAGCKHYRRSLNLEAQEAPPLAPARVSP
ncbi:MULTISPECIES: MFS transporter [Achromobacter]|uniref:MFS transporter n=1 Tax=Alcaligenes xylosoxydans xylosoxydans TaxID=85698 RepID=A0A424W4E6_ALCXX|nr:MULTISPECIES: MFS transporter [Achromobacter]MBC9904418.1 MFS transporter [Achromobacter xylosoxidans]MBD0872586.1 MFS transporter [Achromobacter xylosoxidans]MDH1300296.1 MFS transporter [Achromobacter sp. GD03932]QNP88097.1 MFS transporter [Achromobacter xylosoxidans]RPJ88159.1 MFS transporter [Achromobacter xylosoxidans]